MDDTLIECECGCSFIRVAHFEEDKEVILSVYEFAPSLRQSIRCYFKQLFAAILGRPISREIIVPEDQWYALLFTELINFNLKAEK